MNRCCASLTLLLLAWGCSDPGTSASGPPAAPVDRPQAEAVSEPTGEALHETPDEPTGEDVPDEALDDVPDEARDDAPDEGAAQLQAPSDLPLEELTAVPRSARPWIAVVARQCRGGDAHACWLLGAVHARGTLGEVDRPRAHALFERACTREDGFGCVELATYVGPAEALTALGRGCDADHANACQVLATRLEGSDPVASTRARMRACSLGRALVCLPVPTPFPHDASPAAPGSPSEASRIPSGANATVHGAAQRCDRGMAAMCAWLTFQYVDENDFGLDTDRAHAIELARQSCNDTATAGCLPLGMLLMSSARSAGDAGAAGVALSRACAAGIAQGCAANALVIERMPRLAPLAEMFRFEACILGDHDSC